MNAIINNIRNAQQEIINNIAAGDKLVINGKSYTVEAKGEGRWATLVEVKGARGAIRMISWNNEQRGGNIFSMKGSFSQSITTMELV